MVAVSKVALLVACAPVALGQLVSTTFGIKHDTSALAVFPDKVDDGCTIGQYCSPNVGIPHLRGLCVAANSRTECWDACNDAHAPMDYAAASTQVGARKGFALFIKQVRTGARGSNSCPGGARTVASCNAGERCVPYQGAHWGQGMCTTVTGQGNQCLDMCDTSITIDQFKETPGKAAGTVNTVELVRAGRDPAGRTFCPGATVWIWLWFPITLCIAVGCCALSYFLFGQYRKTFGKSRGNFNRATRDDIGMERMEEPYVEYGEQPGQMEQGYSDPMPVMEPQVEARGSPKPQAEAPQARGLEEPLAAPTAAVEPVADSGLFGAPNLMSGLAPPATTVYAAPGTSYLPTTTSGYGLPYTTAQPYTMGGSTIVSGGGQIYGGSTVVSGAGLATQPYGAYGAYNTVQTGVYPTGSMRIG